MHVYRSSQHVAKLAARPGTRHQRKTASNYAGSSILLLQPASPPQAASHASKQARRDASHAKQEQGLLSCPVPRKKKMHAPRNRFWRLGRLRASLPIGPLAFSPVGAKIFLLLFFLSPGGGVVVNGQDGRARCVCCLRCGGRAPLSTGVGFRFTPCLLAVARETLDFRRGRCRQPNSNLLTPRVLVAQTFGSAQIFCGYHRQKVPGILFFKIGKLHARVRMVGVCIISSSSHSSPAYASTDATSNRLMDFSPSLFVPRVSSILTIYSQSTCRFRGSRLPRFVVCWRAKPLRG